MNDKHICTCGKQNAPCRYHDLDLRKDEPLPSIGVNWPERREFKGYPEPGDTNRVYEFYEDKGFNLAVQAFMSEIAKLPHSKEDLDEKEVIAYLKELLLTPKKLEQKPTIAELENILNSEEGRSLAMLPNGEIACINPKVSIEGIGRAIVSRFARKRVDIDALAKVCFDAFIVDGTWKNLSTWDKYRMAKDYKNSLPYKLAKAIVAHIEESK